ncbi:MAG: serine hydrolase domain-containing protein [Bacteroidota bacterium]
MRLITVIFRIVVLFLIIILGGCLGNEKNHKESSKPVLKKEIPNPQLKQFIIQFEKKLASSFAAYNIPGAAVAIVIDSSLTYVKAFGVKSSETQDSVTTNTLFRLASVSKGFASILMGKILSDSAHWNDPIVNDMPEFSVLPQDLTDSITIAHILSHTSGYPYQAYSTLIEDGIDRERLFTELQSVKLSRKPGEIHSYQNVAYSLIEVVIENKLDTTYKHAIEDLLFTPLGMTNTSTTYEEMKNAKDQALPHNLKSKQFIPDELSPAYYNVAAAGGINSSASDMALWLKALLGQRPDLVAKEILDDVFTPRIRTSVKNYHFSNFDRPRKGYYGYGWRIVEYPNDTLIYHGGYANGFKSELGLDRSKNVAICILSNAPSRFSNEMVVSFFEEYKKYLKVVK